MGCNGVRSAASRDCFSAGMLLRSMIICFDFRFMFFPEAEEIGCVDIVAAG